MSLENAMNTIRANRINDELMNDAPIQLNASEQYPNGITQQPFSKDILSTRQLRLKVERVDPEDSKYSLSGGFLEYTPIQYDGKPLDRIVIDIAPGSDVVVKCTVKWDFSSLGWNLDNGGSPTSGEVFYLTGEYTIVGAEIQIYPPGMTPSDQSPASYTSTRADIDKPLIKYLSLCTINAEGDVIVSPSLDLRHRVIYLSTVFTLQ